MIDLKNKVFLDSDGEMTFENKERLNFIMHFMKQGAVEQVATNKDGTFVRKDAEISFNEIWLPCAELKAKQQATPEGFVLVPTENISTFYQDDSEPENFCTYEADLDNLGDGLDEGEVMVVNKYTQAELTKEKFYGVWCEIETTYGTSRKFKIFKTYDEAKQAMIEAQEQSHD